MERAAPSGVRLPEPSQAELNDPHDASERKDEFTASIAARLRAVSAHLTGEEFAALVRDVVRMSDRFHEIESDPGLMQSIAQLALPLAPLPVQEREVPLPPVTDA